MSEDPILKAACVMKYLRDLADNRGAMADLRCALTDTRRHRAWPWLAAVGGIDDPIIETIASLYACHPKEVKEGNIGTTCQRLRSEHNSFDMRFRRLLGCERDELGQHLRPIVLAAKAKDIPINYEQFFVDVVRWNWNEHTKARWATEYWGVSASTANMAEEAEV